MTTVTVEGEAPVTIVAVEEPGVAAEAVPAGVAMPAMLPLGVTATLTFWPVLEGELI